MKLSVVIVNYNVKYYLHQCLRSVEQAVACGIDAEIIVVDNHSTDGSIAFLSRLHPGVRFIVNDDNLGFARANNLALRQARGEYVVLLNPDTIVDERTFARCIAFMDTHPDAGATGVRMLKADGTFALESRRGFPTPLTALYKMTGLCQLLPRSRRFGRYYMQYLDASAPAEIEVISGAYMFVRRATLERSGLLDEDFFMYGEDIDLSYRLRLTGAKNYYLPTRILHYKGESTKKHSWRYVQMFHEAMLLFMRKHFAHYGRLLTVPIRAAIYLRQWSIALRAACQRAFARDTDLCQHLQSLDIRLYGRGGELRGMRHILQQYGVTPSTTTASAEWPRRGRGGVLVVNAERLTYAQILDLLEHTATTKCRPALATYYPSLRRIILASFVLPDT